MKKRALILGLAVLPVLVAVGAAVAAGAFDKPKSSTTLFHDVDKAKAAGYTVTVFDKAGLQCIAEPGEGAMGIHLLNPKLLDDKIEADKPELLVYERRNDGSMKLVALEYLIFQSMSHGRPSLFGKEFDEIPADNRYGIPASWALHAWIWKPNPSGMLSPGTHGSIAVPEQDRDALSASRADRDGLHRRRDRLRPRARRGRRPALHGGRQRDRRLLFGRRRLEAANGVGADVPPKGYLPIEWNATGPRGAQGPQGPTGRSEQPARPGRRGHRGRPGRSRR